MSLISAHAGVYFTGDGASRDENGLYRISGRVDDIIMSKGHRIGTAELECAMVSDFYMYMYLPSLISGCGLTIVSYPDPTQNRTGDICFLVVLCWQSCFLLVHTHS